MKIYFIAGFIILMSFICGSVAYYAIVKASISIEQSLSQEMPSNPSFELVFKHETMFGYVYDVYIVGINGRNKAGEIHIDQRLETQKYTLYSHDFARPE